ncbi:MAG: heparinase II/III family protein [Clostridia bacterium]|nr:heparinase II/III family protein [Clostridia bacterium]
MKICSKFTAILLAVLMLTAYMPVFAQLEVNPMETYSGVHPRIFTSELQLAESKLLKDGEYKDIFDSLKNYVDSVIETGVPAYYEDESLEDGWMRAVADNIIKICFVYKMTDDETYKTALWDFVNTVMAYPSWGRGESYENKNLACSHMLIALSVCYDWMYNEMTDTQKSSLENILVERGIALQNAPWWKSSYLSNHLWIGCAAVMTTALAVYDVYDEINSESKALLSGYDSIDAWFNFSESKMNRAFSMFADDGSSHEGAQYYNYGMEYVIYYVEASEKFRGFDCGKIPFFENTAEFISRMLITENVDESGISVFNFGDSTIKISAATAAQLYYWANKFNNVNAYKTADFIRGKFKDEYKYNMWKVLLYGLDSVSASGYNKEMENDAVYSEMGYAFSKVNSGNANTVTSLAIKCGTPGGVKNINSDRNYGFSHVHPDNNNFMLFSGRTALFTDDGYSSNSTSYDHNTLSINGEGQYGEEDSESESDQWKGGYNVTSEISAYESGEKYFYAVGDATGSYPSELNLKKYKRHFVFLKPDILVLIDDVEMNSANGDVLTLSLYPSPDKKIENYDNRTVAFSDDYNRVVVKSFGAEPAVVKSQKNINIRGAHHLTLSSTEQSWKQITAISWGKPDETVPYINVTKNGDIVKITIDNENNGTVNREITVNVAESSISGYTDGEAPVRVAYDDNSKSISVSGTSNAKELISVKATGPEKNLVYLDQKVSDGSYNFLFGISENGLGRYDVSVYDGTYNGIVKAAVNATSGNSGYKFSEAEILIGNTKAEGRVKFINNADITENVVVFLAMYENGILTGLEKCDISADGNESISSQLSLIHNGAENKEFTLFAWDGSLKPVLKAITK